MEFQAIKTFVVFHELCANLNESPVVLRECCIHPIEAPRNGALKFVQYLNNLAERRFTIHNWYQALRTLP